jgi:hypothetical protein
MPEGEISSGEPDAGNLHVRFDEGRGTLVPSYSILYRFRRGIGWSGRWFEDSGNLNVCAWERKEGHRCYMLCVVCDFVDGSPQCPLFAFC